MEFLFLILVTMWFISKAPNWFLIFFLVFCHIYLFYCVCCWFFFSFLLFWDGIALCSPGWPGIFYVALSDLRWSSYLCFLSARIIGTCYLDWHKSIMIINFICVHVCMHSTFYEGQSTTFRSWLSSSTPWVQGIQLISSGLMTSAFSLWAILLAYALFL